MSEQVDCVVVGAGVVGLAVARALALQGREVMVLEAAEAIGTGTSSRNSEVIHAGIYYPQGSLKARFCVEGRQRLYAYCEERGVAHQRCGKLIVATDEAQRGQLQAIARKAEANGVNDLRWLDGPEARALEPALQCVAAMHSPSTGIIDSHGLMLALQGDLENAGGMVVCHAEVQEAAATSGGVWLRTATGTQLQARSLVNAAGLNAPLLAARGARVILEVGADLVSTMRDGLDGVAAVIVAGSPPPAFDYRCPLMSLPGVFGATPDGIPGAVPFLSADPAACARWKTWNCFI